MGNASSTDISNERPANLSIAPIITKIAQTSVVESVKFFGFIECRLDTIKVGIAIVLALLVVALLFKRLIAAAIAIPELGIKASVLIGGLLASTMSMAGAENAEEAVGRSCNVGDCTFEEHSELELIKDEYCSESFSCRQGMGEGVLAEKSLIALACAEARKDIMDRCFGGGDEGHQEAYESAIRAHENCTIILSGI